MSWRELFAGMLRARAKAEGKPYGGENTPGYVRRVETLCEWFPECGVIQVVRDSRDVVSSLARMGWAAWRITARENDVRVKYEDLVDGREEELGRLRAHRGVVRGIEVEGERGGGRAAGGACEGVRGVDGGAGGILAGGVRAVAGCSD